MATDEDPITLGQESFAPPRLREFAAIAAWVVVADASIYHGSGYAGLGLLLAATPFLAVLGAPRFRMHGSAWIVWLMLLLLAGRATWLGAPLTGIVGVVLLIAYGVSLHGRAPLAWDVPIFALQTVAAGYAGLQDYRQWITNRLPHIPRMVWLNGLLPLVALVVFGTIFIMANPDLARSISQTLQAWLQWPSGWADIIAQRLPEILFWMGSAWLGIGFLRPLVQRSAITTTSEGPTTKSLPPVQAQWYKPVRNMLLAVNGLFAAYLVFEFQTLWFREFPPGFYYAGYAHEGAAWLTVALGLATLLLSLIFHRPLPADPRTTTLRRLAWAWSALNLVLALAVYNRMHVYIDFNGMTRMRMIGLFGISTVVAGFLLVMWKIARERDFLWLVARQLWALAIAVYLFALTPVDTIVHAYNVRQILSGDLAPAVQITEHPINAEGMLMLAPLLQCDDPIIRDGIRALHAEWALREAIASERRAESGWTSYQASDALLTARLESCHKDWAPYRNNAKRAAAAWKAFQDYAYQWY
jgi:hypothetical protein